jgi:tRNA1Val (adenine37-N6)-methyltransferase
MPTNPFKFKQFTIIQEKSAMKVGTDGVLLGAWTSCENAKTILDIGTGTGLIALMLAQKSEAQITAIEIDAQAANEAKQNVENSPWGNRISVFNESIQEFTNKYPSKYDLIVSNPPFFSKSKKAENEARTLARHNDNLSLIDLMSCADLLLNEIGAFIVIIPADDVVIVTEEAHKKHLLCVQKLWIKPTPEIDTKRALLAFSRVEGECKESTMVLEMNGRHNYSDEYKKLTQDYYLNF